MLHEDRYGILKSYSTIARAKGNTDSGSKGEEKTANFYVIMFKGSFQGFFKSVSKDHIIEHIQHGPMFTKNASTQVTFYRILNFFLNYLCNITPLLT